MEHKFTSVTQEIAKKTYRPWNHNVPVCYRLIFNNLINPLNKAILDYGCGPEQKYVKQMRAMKLNAVGVDFHIPGSRQTHLAPQCFYDIIIASNVLNVISDMKDLHGVFAELKSHLTPNGFAIANYPSSPRKLKLSNSQLLTMLGSTFKLTKLDKDMVNNNIVVMLTNI